MTRLLFQFQHVKVHETGVLILVFLGQMNEAVLFIEGNGGEVGIDGDETESGIGRSGVRRTSRIA